jgi:predicted ArsR family transcriptional regulator
MAPGEKAGDAETITELVEQTRGPRARVIDGLLFYEGEAHAQQLRRYGDVPSSTYHFEKLEVQELIEQTGQKYISDGGVANVYRLTDLGREVGDELFDTSGERTAAALEERIDQLREDVGELQEVYNEMAEFVENLDERVEER